MSSEISQDSGWTDAPEDCLASDRVEECIGRQEFAVVQEDALTRLLLIVDLTSLVCGVISCCEVLEEERVANYRNLAVVVIAIFGLQISFKFSDSVEQVLDTLCSIGVGLSYDI
jgi:hypothetical protein